MADNITVRTGEGTTPAGGTETSVKKSKLDQQVEHLAEHIKHRTGRNIDEDTLRAMALRKIAKAEQKELQAATQKEFQKTSGNETLQTAKATSDPGLLIGRGREMHTADGLSKQERLWVTSDPNAAAILPRGTHAPITAEAAANVLEKIFGFMKPASAEAAPLTIETYTETLVPREPTRPGDKTLRQDGQREAGPGEHLEAGAQARTLRDAEHPQRPGDGGAGTGTGTGTGTGNGGEAPIDRPTTGTTTTGTTTGGTTTTGTTTGGTTTPGGTVGEPHFPDPPQHPAEPGGRVPTPQQPQTPGLPRPPSTGGTIHLAGHRVPGQVPGQAPQQSGQTLLGKTTVGGAHATDGSTSTPLGKTATKGGARGVAAGANLKSSKADLRADDQPIDRPVGGTTTTGVIIPDEHEEHPQRPIGTEGRPVAGDDDDGDSTLPPLPKPPGDRKTIHLKGERLPGRQPGQAPAQSGATLLGKTTVAGAHATDVSTSTPLGHTTLTTPRGTGDGKPVVGNRPGTGGTVGGPVGGRPRALTPLGHEKSGGATLSLRARGGRSLRATDVTTEHPVHMNTNTGGGFDTTTSWDGMHFNWEAFFVKFMFTFQKDENEARRLMKELREAMHKLAQEGIKAKIAIEKMNQAFERAEKAFEVGAALKGVMDAAAGSAQQAQQGQGQGQGQEQANGAQNPNSQAGRQNPQDAGATPRPPTQTNGGPPQQSTGQGRGAADQGLGTNPSGEQATPTEGDTPRGQQTAGGNPRAGRQGGNQGQQQQGQGQQQGGGNNGLPGGGLVGNVSEFLRRDLEKLNQELISSAQRGGSEMDARIRSAYMQAQGLFNQMCQLLAMSRSK